MTPFQRTLEHITKIPTVTYGLKYFPSLEPHASNDRDDPAWGWHSGPEVSDCNLGVVADVMERIRSTCGVVMEIGVHRNEGRSMTNILMDKRPPNSIYLGIDIDDKSYLNNFDKKTYTVRCNSHDQLVIRNKLKSIGANKIDVLMIDGWHSVNTCVNDWKYVDLLSDNGVVILHDTNAHPGCVALFDAVDETLFDKERFCTDPSDMGIATFWHKK